MNRREFLSTLGLASAAVAQSPPLQNADFTLKIGPVIIELAPKKIARTVGYNGTAPGPLLRMAEGKSVTIDVVNGTSAPEIVHWHGLHIPSAVDGSMEEGTPMVAPGATGRYTFMPAPSGTRCNYNTCASDGADDLGAAVTCTGGFWMQATGTICL